MVPAARQYSLMSATARRALLGLTLLGLAASGTSAWVHHRLLNEPGYTSFCDVSSTVNCADVYLSPYGSAAGVSVAAWGVLYFLLVGLLAWAAGRRSSVGENAAGYLFAASTVGLAAILYLAYTSWFVLGTVCLLCLATYVAVIGLFGISGAVTSFPLTSLPGRLMDDLRGLPGSPAALAATAGLAVATFLTVTWGATGGPATPAAVAETASEGDVPSEFERWYTQQPRVALPVEADGADVVVVKFNDYQCPPCRNTYMQYKGIFEKYAESQPGRIRYVTKHYPLDPECNADAPAGTHLAACEAAVSVLLAARHGRAERLEQFLFDNQGSLTPNYVRDAASQIGGVPDFDAQYDAVLEQVRQDIALGTALGVEATPTFFINGVKITGGLQPQFFDAALAFELAQAGQ